MEANAGQKTSNDNGIILASLLLISVNCNLNYLCYCRKTHSIQESPNVPSLPRYFSKPSLILLSRWHGPILPKLISVDCIVTARLQALRAQPMLVLVIILLIPMTKHLTMFHPSMMASLQDLWMIRWTTIALLWFIPHLLFPLQPYSLTLAML